MFRDSSQALNYKLFKNDLDLYWWEFGDEGWRRKEQTGCESEAK